MGKSLLYLIIISLVSCSPIGYAGETPVYMQSFQTGAIDWSNGVLHSCGRASLDDLINVRVESENPVLDLAVEKARSNLLELVYQVRVDAATVLKEIAAGNDAMKDKIIGMVENADKVGVEGHPDGSVEVAIEMALAGGFSQLVLPSEITQLQSIKPMQARKRNVSSESIDAQAVPGKDSEAYSGLVVDASGLKAVPAMAPRILDEKGEQVYGASYISREYAVQNGVCGYAGNLREAMSNPRVKSAPLVVKGLRTNGPALSDIVISNKDALRIRGSFENLTFLKKCRVMIVLD